MHLRPRIPYPWAPLDPEFDVEIGKALQGQANIGPGNSLAPGKLYAKRTACQGSSQKQPRKILAGIIHANLDIAIGQGRIQSAGLDQERRMILLAFVSNAAAKAGQGRAKLANGPVMHPAMAKNPEKPVACRQNSRKQPAGGSGFPNIALRGLAFAALWFARHPENFPACNIGAMRASAGKRLHQRASLAQYAPCGFNIRAFQGMAHK